MPLTMEQMEEEINALHSVLEARGVNTKRTADIFGREFDLPVNSEHKATVCTTGTLCSIAQPHMRTFWAATIGFFCTFFSCFAPGALGVYYKRSRADGGLELDGQTLSDAGAFAVTGTILMRVLAGPMCDTFGARWTFIILLLIGIPGMIIFATAQGGATFMLGRIIIGLSLATFVTCQVWCSQFFDRSIVGKVNATAGGWGNLGGGITLLTMPYIMEFFLSVTGSNIGASWRLCMLVPIFMHLGSAFFIWTGRDLPDGSYKQLENAGVKQKSKGAGNVAKLGFSNTNALIMLVTYGLCFGVELCMNNKLVPYFTRYYGMRPTTAGPLGACFSLMNLAARSWGGMLSDILAKKYGIRGRIWGMWVIQTIEGFFCILMGLVTVSMDGPDEAKFKGLAKVQGIYDYGATTYTIDGTLGAVKPCSSELVRSPANALVGGVLTKMPIPEQSLIMIRDPAANCVHNGGTLATTMICMICFSIW
jgi:NNP family nitrate/nitrite transporter-like MFS transporter